KSRLIRFLWGKKHQKSMKPPEANSWIINAVGMAAKLKPSERIGWLSARFSQTATRLFTTFRVTAACWFTTSQALLAQKQPTH
ncbi:MAG: hypothetical protein KAR17_12260, partial [Cyclobacteriaceae bacterium]|nr:hypothetical protein [Cyclobacteriaceae bacterium]